MNADTFPDDVVELIRYLLPNEGACRSSGRRSGQRLPARGVVARLLALQCPAGRGCSVSRSPSPITSHPSSSTPALETYRSNFRPSILHNEPRAMVAVTVLCAPTEAEATWLSGSSALSILHLRTGRLGLLPSPEEAEAYPFTSAEMAIVEESMSSHLIGTPEAVFEGLVELERRTSADEFMISTRIHSYEGTRPFPHPGCAKVGIDAIFLTRRTSALR